MIEASNDPGRIDLRAIDEPTDVRQADRVIAAALSHFAQRAYASSDVVSSIATFVRPLLPIAAALLIGATGTLVLAGTRRHADSAASVITGWAESNHVPANGELLATFQGYSR